MLDFHEGFTFRKQKLYGYHPLPFILHILIALLHIFLFFYMATDS